MAKKVSYKGKNSCIICYSAGMTDNEIVEVIKKRIAKRQIELDKRKWIYDEYRSLEKKQDIDKSWLYSFEKQGFSVEKGE